jgi:hypothetical protein
MANRVTVVKDNVSQVFKSLEELLGNQVLIGVPEANADRKDDEGGPANNAVIGYTMEFGSPEHNIPARPHLVPGVQKAEKPAVEQLKKAAAAALDGDPKKADQFLTAAGIIGANEVRGMINSNIPPPLSPETVRRRKYARGTKSRRESEEVYLDLINKGVTPEAAQSETGIVSLVNTAQYRNAITSVVRKK